MSGDHSLLSQSIARYSFVYTCRALLQLSRRMVVRRPGLAKRASTKKVSRSDRPCLEKGPVHELEDLGSHPFCPTISPQTQPSNLPVPPEVFTCNIKIFRLMHRMWLWSSIRSVWRTVVLMTCCNHRRSFRVLTSNLAIVV